MGVKGHLEQKRKYILKLLFSDILQPTGSNFRPFRSIFNGFGDISNLILTGGGQRSLRAKRKYFLKWFFYDFIQPTRSKFHRFWSICNGFGDISNLILTGGGQRSRRAKTKIFFKIIFLWFSTTHWCQNFILFGLSLTVLEIEAI